jgi:hypothetical protein
MINSVPKTYVFETYMFRNILNVIKYLNNIPKLVPKQKD